MTPDKEQGGSKSEPRGFGEHTRGLSGEYAHEQGWGLAAEQRMKAAIEPQNTTGGNDYDYGARDFGDEPVNTAIPPKPNANSAKSAEKEKD